MIDYHIHPNYSIDAEGRIDEFCRTALERKFREICFTTHLDTDAARKDAYVIVRGKRVDARSSSWLEDYENSIRMAGDQYKGQGLEVRLGVEVDYYPGVMDHLPERFHDTEFDLVMGSAHLVNNLAISVKEESHEFFSKHNLEQMGNIYFSLLGDCVESGLFDVLGHLDLYRRFGEAFYGGKIRSLWKAHVSELASVMKRFNVGFEVNTSSLRKGMDEPMPESSLVAALKKEGIETVTVGSDAHRPSDVGQGIEIALKVIKECGFDSPSSFERRRATPFVVQESP
ncbi:MAG: histidinol-phosphatase HisJ family protein [Candidatus Thorarchaeota archaeon]